MNTFKMFYFRVYPSSNVFFLNEFPNNTLYLMYCYKNSVLQAYEEALRQFYYVIFSISKSIASLSIYSQLNELKSSHCCHKTGSEAGGGSSG